MQVVFVWNQTVGWGFNVFYTN